MSFTAILYKLKNKIRPNYNFPYKFIHCKIWSPHHSCWLFYFRVIEIHKGLLHHSIPQLIPQRNMSTYSQIPNPKSKYSQGSHACESDLAEWCLIAADVWCYYHRNTHQCVRMFSSIHKFCCILPPACQAKRKACARQHVVWRSKRISNNRRAPWSSSYSSTLILLMRLSKVTLLIIGHKYSIVCMIPISTLQTHPRSNATCQPCDAG